uniref:BTB domain-containing protein n=1 Tax=Meloidogyne hapla TaxID=6305 RepID=A0A1I8BU01_MELHA
MTLASSSKDGSASLNPMSFGDSNLNPMMERMRYQRASGRFCDACIIVKDKMFSAHRSILAAHSPYFDSVLRFDKIAKEKIVVNCQEPLVFERILNYMYSGTVQIDRDVVVEMLKMTNNLLMLRLKNLCADYLMRYIDVANCLSVKDLATRYNLPRLHTRAIEFFDSNINGCLLENIDLLEYEASQLLSLLEEPQHVNNVRADVYLSLIVRWVGYKLLEREQLFPFLLGRCSLQQILPAKLERLLDSNPFFTQSEMSLHAILQEMHNQSIQMPKYELRYRNLIQRICGDKNSETPQRRRSCSVTGLLSGNVTSSQHHANSSLDIKRSLINDEEGDPEFMSEIGQFSTQQGIIFQLNPQRPCESETTISNNSAMRQCPSGSLKLKIHLPMKQEKFVCKSINRRLIGLKLYRKSIASATGKTLRRRGRPPKLRPPRPLSDFTGVDDEPNSVFFEFAEETEGPIPAVVFDEDEDEFDPERVEFFEENDEQQIQQHLYNSGQQKSLEKISLGNEIEGNSSNKSVQCPHCSFSTHQGIVHLNKHIIATHSKNVLYVCNKCGGSCTYSADRLPVLLTHRLIHTNERPLKCPDCSFRCRNKSNMIVHYRLHSGEKPFKCNICSKRFVLKRTLENHSITHQEERPFLCDHCDFSTKYQSHLISHKRIHSGDLYRCHITACDYSSPKKSQLAAHLRTHLNVRSHKCRTCNRSFIEKSHLVRHERIHLEEKPFKCQNCDYASSRRDKLKEHILKHHNNQGSSTKLLKRRYRRARQLQQLMAQGKLLPPTASSEPSTSNPQQLPQANFFRPILINDQQQQQHISTFNQQHQKSQQFCQNNSNQNQFLEQQQQPHDRFVYNLEALNVAGYSGSMTTLMSGGGQQHQQYPQQPQQCHLMNRPLSVQPIMVTNNGDPNDLVNPSCFSMASDFQQHDNECNSGSIRMDVQLQQQQPTQITNIAGQRNSRSTPSNSALSTPGPPSMAMLDNTGNDGTCSQPQQQLHHRELQNLANSNFHHSFDPHKQQQYQGSVGAVGPQMLGTGLLFSSAQLYCDSHNTQQQQQQMSIDQQHEQQQLQQQLNRPMSLPNYGAGSTVSIQQLHQLQQSNHSHMDQQGQDLHNFQNLEQAMNIEQWQEEQH